MYAYAKSGGWFEFTKFSFSLHSDDTLTKDTKTGFYFDLFTECVEKVGIHLVQPEVRKKTSPREDEGGGGGGGGS